MEGSDKTISLSAKRKFKSKDPFLSPDLDSHQNLIMSHIQKFLTSFIKHIPRIRNLSNHVQTKSSLIVNYPLILGPTASNRLAITSQSTIKRDNLVLLLAAGECIFSEGFSGATASEEKKIREDLQQLSEQYQSINKNFLDRMNIYLQFIAGKQTMQQGEMPQKDFTEYVLGGEGTTFQKGDINSRYLSNLYMSWEINNKVIFNYLQKGIFKRVQEQDYIDTITKSKEFIRGTGKAPFLFAAPFLDKFDHSFDPNCQFDMIYLPHRRSPFVCIRTLRDILPNQRPTLNYGNLNNYQLLLRYGFCVKNNPYSVFMLLLNFQNIVEVFNKNIQWKQKQMLARDMKLKNFVKILPNGALAPQDLLMMRILICDAQNPTEERLQSDKYDSLIYKFIRGHAEHMKNNIKINNYLVSKNKEVKILQEEEISILKNFLDQHSS